MARSVVVNPIELVPFVHESLGNSSYLVGVGRGEAVVIDPDRTVARYLAEAKRRGWRVIGVFETHLHADFVTGSNEIREHTGSVVHASAEGRLGFPHRGLASGDRIEVGGVEIEAIGSPGHAPEHLAYLVRLDAAPPMLFSGGALIVGGAARTDLVAADRTEPLTRDLFTTLHGAFNTLPDETLLLPTHGGGSFCSVGSANDERTSTLGDERRSNPVLAVSDEEEFVAWFPSTFPSTPSYFFRMRDVNRAGPAPVATIQLPQELEPTAFERAMIGDALVVDVRGRREYAEGHVPGSLAIPFVDHSFATWLGWLVPSETSLLLVTGSVPLGSVVNECLLVGYERFAGVLSVGMEAWRSAGLGVARLPEADPAEAGRLIESGAVALDVREPDEFERGHVEGAAHIPLGSLADRRDELPGDRTIVAYCGSGDRSSTAASILERAGFASLVSLEGGYGAWRGAHRD